MISRRRGKCPSSSLALDNFFPIEIMAISCFLRLMNTHVLMSRFGPFLITETTAQIIMHHFHSRFLCF